jgi:inorganic pyrophosphatase
MSAPERFWLALDELVSAARPVIDRPRGSVHPRYPATVYPLDYGYLPGTRSADGSGIDIWVGSLAAQRVTALIGAVDLLKGDLEFKLLLGCTQSEAEQIAAFHNQGAQAAFLLERQE